MKNDKLISMNMPEDMILELKKLAGHNSLTMSAQIRIIILEYLRTHRVED